MKWIGALILYFSCTIAYAQTFKIAETQTFPIQVASFPLLQIDPTSDVNTLKTETSPPIPSKSAPTPIPALNQDRWTQLKTACERCYNGVNLEFDISLGAKASSYETKTATEPYAQMTVKVPFLSKSERIKGQDDKRRFLLEGARIIGEIEDAEILIEILNQAVGLKSKIADEEGAAIIDDLIKIKRELANATVKRNEALRKFEAYTQCGTK